MQQFAAIKRTTTFIIQKHNREFVPITRKSTVRVTSPFNEERNELEFMWLGDKVTHDRDDPCRTHNSLISLPCVPFKIRVCITLHSLVGPERAGDGGAYFETRRCVRRGENDTKERARALCARC